MRNGGAQTTAYIAIGSNLGDRARYCYSAISRLCGHAQISVSRLSPLIETAPVGGPVDAPPFLNGAIEIQTSLGSHALFNELQTIENDLGRVRKERWEPRIIDLDLIFYGDRIISSDELMIPHPMMHQRLFVLEPLSMIAPDVVHPTLQMTVKGLLENLRTSASSL